MFENHLVPITNKRITNLMDSVRREEDKLAPLREIHVLVVEWGVRLESLRLVVVRLVVGAATDNRGCNREKNHKRDETERNKEKKKEKKKEKTNSGNEKRKETEIPNHHPHDYQK